MRIFTDEILDRIIAEAADQRPHGPKGLPEDEIDINSPADWSGSKTFIRQSRREALRERLEVAAESHRLAKKSQARPSQLDMAKEYEADEAKLYEALRSLLPADPIARKRKQAALAVGMRAGDASQEIVGLYRLYRAARSARQRKQAKPKTPHNERHKGDWALDNLIVDLVAIYEHVFGRERGTSNRSGSAGAEHEGKTGGPMIRFIETAMSPILSKVPTRAAIRARVIKVMGSTRKKT